MLFSILADIFVLLCLIGCNENNGTGVRSLGPREALGNGSVASAMGMWPGWPAKDGRYIKHHWVTEGPS